MPRYVYACNQVNHAQKEVIHRMTENPEIVCEVCGEQMHRVPQPVMHYNNPYETLLKMMDDKYIEWRKRNARNKRRFEA